MRRWWVLSLLMVVALPAWPAKRVSAAQLEQILSGLAAAHKADPDVAREIGFLEPSERISDATLDRLNRKYSPGPQTSTALQLLADRSSFLDLPAAELSPVPAPDAATQQKQITMARQFALDTLPRLPNLFATRTTYSFDDSPQQVREGAWAERAGLHLVGVSKIEVSVHSERAALASSTGSKPEQQSGLMTWGEFGSALLLILNDATHGATTWSHWEQSQHGLLSVFHYEVPKSASHYEISAPVEEVTHLGGSGRWMGYGRGVGLDSVTTQIVQVRPAYHGSLWIDPSTGAILRVSLVADLKNEISLAHAAVEVDYGLVQIGDKSYICPVRSLALSNGRPNVNATISGATTEWLNENLFTHYHLFAASARILGGATQGAGETGAVAESAASAQAEAPPPATTLPVPPPAATSPALPAEPALSPLAPAETPAAAPPGSNETHTGVPLPAEAAPAAPPAAPPPSLAPAAEATAPLPETKQADPGLTLHINVSAVLVPVVVRNGAGQTVDGLEVRDFEVLDNGKPRPVSGFLVERRAVPHETAQAGSAPAESAAAGAALPDRVTVFVFDDLHLTSDQIAYARKAAVGSLDEALTGSDMAAVVTTSGRINSGVVRDRTALSAAILAVRPEALYSGDASSCPKISYYQADLIVNKNDATALQDAIDQVMTVCTKMPPTMINLARNIAESTARSVLQAGDQDLRTTYAILSEYVRRMARLPGRHTMVLISPGFLPIEEEARTEEAQLISLAADSNVTINSLDASGLDTTAMKASDDVRNRNLLLMQNLRDDQKRAEDNSIVELASATGGLFFHNNNDLAAGFRTLLEAPATVYVLELPLAAVKKDGAWHRLSVKVDRADTHIQARRGYFAPGKSESKTQH